MWQKGKEDRGLVLRGKNWTIRYRVYGKVRWETVGPSKAMAKKLLVKRKNEVREGRFFPEARWRHTTFDALVEAAVKDTEERFRRQHPGETFRRGRYNTILRWFPGRPAASITQQEIEGKVNQHAKADASFNRLRVAISHVFKLAMKDGKVMVNPGQKVEMRKENNVRVRWLEEEEEAALRTVIREKFPHREPEFDLALHSGMRWSEQYRKLRWENVNVKLRFLTIPRSKSGLLRRIQLNADALAALKKLRALAGTSEIVCPHAYGREHRNWWKTALRESKVRDFHWHDIRHTFASRLVMGGVDIYTVKELMGHAVISVTMRYAHLAPARLQAAVDTLAVSTSVAKSVAAATVVSARIQ